MSDSTRQEVLSRYVVDHLDTAIEKGYIKAYFQPVLRTLTGEICSVEALARWDDPQYGLLSPALFIPVLENANLIHKLDICMIERICAHYAELKQDDQPLVPVSFNLSRLDFQLCDIHSVIEDAIHSNRLPRDIFHVEITESMMENNEERMQHAINQFWDSGLRVWMDDFGSGYSSLNVLKDFRFDTIKIDMLFLRDFDHRSKEILRAIVDMAKRIGVHTLAEGVETAEQMDFLRSIGCERAQGFYIGKPMPYGECMEHLDRMDFKMELQSKKQYYHDIGRVNVLSPTPLALRSEEEVAEVPAEEGQIALAFIEISDNRIHYLFANDMYLQTLKSVGMESTKSLEALFGDGQTIFGKRCMHLFQKAKTSEEIESINFVRGGKHCFVQVRHIADYPGGSAFISTLQNISTDSGYLRRNQLKEYANVLFSLYEEIELIDLNTGYSQNIYMSTQNLQKYNKLPVAEELRIFAEQQLYPEDRQRFLTFMDPETLEERLNASNASFISAPFRIMTIDGNYVWQLNLLLYAGEKKNRKILCCSRVIDGNAIPLLRQEGFLAGAGSAAREQAADDRSKNMAMSPEMLWNNLVQNSDFKFFWKDKDRKFCGASRSFLDYYDLPDESALIGKNDEEMGWHVDPQPYKSDEEMVLESGARTIEVPGRCINQGEIRDIVASKMPIYDDGRIVGIIGYFRDIAELEDNGQPQDHQAIEIIDPITGILNFFGIVNSTLHYQESYQKQSLDFGVIYLNIENFRAYNKNHGVEWGNALLKAVGQDLRRCVGTMGVVARYSGDHFMVLMQCNSDQDLWEQIKNIEKSVQSIKTIDRIPCTVYFKKGIARYSEVHNLQDLYNLAEERARK